MRVARILSVLALLGLSGCSLAPRLELPVVSAASNYKGAADWGLVSAADDGPRGEWWTAFDDPALDELMQRLDHASPTVATAADRSNDGCFRAGRIQRLRPGLQRNLRRPRL